jgi:cob(I)alamin adenosyltransferase
MSIYTKTGDKGTTSLTNDKRVLKSDPIIEAGGSLDELNSFIGLVIVKAKEKGIKKLLTNIQKDMSQIMTILAGKNIILQGLENAVNNFEQIIDNYQTKLPKLDRFILPQGTELSCYFHILRTICRRTERNIVKLKYREKYSFEQAHRSPAQLGDLRRAQKDVFERYLFTIIQYLNRLSDLFFILSRWYNKGQEIII